MKKTKLLPGGVSRRGVDDQPVVVPEIVDREVVESGSDSPWVGESRQDLGRSPLLTAAKLEAIVRRFDVTGPMRLGAFYQERLHEECALLLPQPVYGFDDWRFFEMLATWHRNSMFFKCRAIGDVLAYLEMARQNYETMRQNDVDHNK